MRPVVKLDQSGRVCPAKPRRFVVIEFVVCTALAEALRTVSAMAIIATGKQTNEGRRIMARLNYLGRMLRRIRREEKKCVIDSAKSYNRRCPLLGVKRTSRGLSSIFADSEGQAAHISQAVGYLAGG